MLEIITDELYEGLLVAGRYRLSRIVGEGGMGVVWAATHELTGKSCALKFLKESRASDPRNHRRLLQEARAACAVRHPNVAQVHDILELSSGVPFIVMDLLEGESLRLRLVQRGRLDLMTTAGILVSVIDAVAAAHSFGVVHRDLKPDNVFLERGPLGEDVVRVLDFGIAKRLDATTGSDLSSRSVAVVQQRLGSLTTTFSAIGTPPYMAPEQLSDSANIDGRVDVWSLGVIAFECLVGRRPEGTEAPEVMNLSRALEPLHKVAPRDLVRLVERMLQVDPDARPLLEEVRKVFARYAIGTTGHSVELPVLPEDRSQGSKQRLVSRRAARVAALMLVALGGVLWLRYPTSGHSTRSDAAMRANDGPTHAERSDVTVSVSNEPSLRVGTTPRGNAVQSARMLPSARQAPELEVVDDASSNEAPSASTKSLVDVAPTLTAARHTNRRAARRTEPKSPEPAGRTARALHGSSPGASSVSPDAPSSSAPEVSLVPSYAGGIPTYDRR